MFWNCMCMRFWKRRILGDRKEAGDYWQAGRGELLARRGSSWRDANGIKLGSTDSCATL